MDAAGAGHRDGPLVVDPSATTRLSRRGRAGRVVMDAGSVVQRQVTGVVDAGSRAVDGEDPGVTRMESVLPVRFDPAGIVHDEGPGVADQMGDRVVSGPDAGGPAQDHRASVQDAVGDATGTLHHEGALVDHANIEVAGPGPDVGVGIEDEATGVVDANALTVSRSHVLFDAAVLLHPQDPGVEDASATRRPVGPHQGLTQRQLAPVVDAAAMRDAGRATIPDVEAPDADRDPRLDGQDTGLALAVRTRTVPCRASSSCRR